MRKFERQQSRLVVESCARAVVSKRAEIDHDDFRQRVFVDVGLAQGALVASAGKVDTCGRMIYVIE